jgi:hypothetical protein
MTIWAVGTALIVLSWINAVPSLVGWIGFGVTILASLVSLGLGR